VNEVLATFLVSFSAIFFVVDPLSAVPMFLAMTRSDSVDKRRQTALRAAVAAALVLSGFALGGAWIFGTRQGLGLPT